MGAGVRLRSLTADDWVAWRALRLRALAEDPEAFGSTLAEWTGQGDREDRWRARLSIPGARDLVADLGGVPVGMASAVPSDGPDVVEVISMWVAPEARGRGVGAALLSALVEWAAAAGAREIRLSVADGNAAAAGLYLRQGFVFTGEVGDLMPDGRPERVMVRPAG